MKAQSILELRIATEFAIAKNFTETLNKIKKGNLRVLPPLWWGLSIIPASHVNSEPNSVVGCASPICGQHLKFINNIVGGAQVAIA
jgi:hypothetical protein